MFSQTPKQRIFCLTFLDKNRRLRLICCKGADEVILFDNLFDRNKNYFLSLFLSLLKNNDQLKIYIDVRAKVIYFFYCHGIDYMYLRYKNKLLRLVHQTFLWVFSYTSMGSFYPKFTVTNVFNDYKCRLMVEDVINKMCFCLQRN